MKEKHLQSQEVSNQVIAGNLKKLFETKRKELKLTQNGCAEELGISQPAVSQMMNNKIPVPTNLVLKWAHILEVHPVEINPELTRVALTFRGSVKTTKCDVYVMLATGKNKMPKENIIQVEVPENVECRSLFAVEISSDIYEPGLSKGDKLIVNPVVPPKLRNKVIVETTDNEVHYGVLTNIGKRSYTLVLLNDGQEKLKILSSAVRRVLFVQMTVQNHE